MAMEEVRVENGSESRSPSPSEPESSSGPEENGQSDTSPKKPYYCMRGLKMGRFCEAEKREDGMPRFLYGKFRTIWSHYRTPPSKCKVELRYRAYCDGCSKCKSLWVKQEEKRSFVGRIISIFRPSVYGNSKEKTKFQFLNALFNSSLECFFFSGFSWGESKVEGFEPELWCLGLRMRGWGSKFKLQFYYNYFKFQLFRRQWAQHSCPREWEVGNPNWKGVLHVSVSAWRIPSTLQGGFDLESPSSLSGSGNFPNWSHRVLFHWQWRFPCQTHPNGSPKKQNPILCPFSSSLNY